jgi:NodT family efflux transporter outer membrane factor (OMF) lipoprotein
MQARMFRSALQVVHVAKPLWPRATALAVAIALGGCSVEPVYTRPTVETPAHYLETGTPGTSANAAGWQPAQPGDSVSRGAWWTVFGDPDLDALEARVEISNQTLRKAVAALDAARSNVAFARAGLLPTVSAGLAQDRNRTSANVVGRSLAGKTVSDYAVGLDASWEPDLFGKIRSQVDASQADAQASEADLEAVRLAVDTELAVDYFDLRATDNEKKLLDDTVAAYREALTMIEQRVQYGVASQADLAEAQAQLEATVSLDTDLDATRAQLQHAMATLIGVPASSFSLPPKLEAQRPTPIPPGLPSALLERRPDIAAAERRVAASNAQIGIAKAAFYPDVVLSLQAGLESSAFAPWLTAPSLFWALGPALAQTLFDGGRRKASLHEADAQYDMAVADYRQTVLTAFQQVEDNLANLRVLNDEAASQQRAVDASQQALKLALDRYKGGAIAYLDVVTIQTTALTNQRAAVDIERRAMDADVLLIKALGGSWA